MLPKILHLYWGQNRPLSFMRYMTAHSFLTLNPDWIIYLWLSDRASVNTPWTSHEQGDYYSGEDHLPRILDSGKVQVQRINFYNYGLSEDMAEVHKSDMIRWIVLRDVGGIWSDFDILYVNPITEAILRQKMVNSIGLCRYRAIPKRMYEYLAIGFMYRFGDEGKLFFETLYRRGVGKFRHGHTRYQAYGAELLKEYLESTEGRESKAINYMDPLLVYPRYQYSDILRYWKPETCDLSKSIGCHWYAGLPESGKAEALVTERNLSEKAVQHQICREVLRIYRG